MILEASKMPEMNCLEIIVIACCGEIEVEATGVCPNPKDWMEWVTIQLNIVVEAGTVLSRLKPIEMKDMALTIETWPCTRPVRVPVSQELLDGALNLSWSVDERKSDQVQAVPEDF